MGLNSKRYIRLFKIFLVSPFLEKIVLIGTIACFAFLTLSIDYNESSNSGGSIKNYFLHEELESLFQTSIDKMEDIFPFL